MLVGGPDGRRAGRVPPRLRRAARRRADARPRSPSGLPRPRAGVARATASEPGEELHRGHARLHAARLGRRRRAGARRTTARTSIGHSMGGMIAAEMAALRPARRTTSWCCVAPLGLWLDEHPIPDIYSLLPFEFPPVLFPDAGAGDGAAHRRRARLRRRRGDPALPDRQRAPARHGRQDPVPDPQPPPVEAALPDHQPDAAGVGRRRPAGAAAVHRAWAAALVRTRERSTIADAGHMAPYEQPAARRRRHCRITVVMTDEYRACIRASVSTGPMTASCGSPSMHPA